jgi:four helix bundle protein
MFVAYEVSRELILELRTIVPAIERHDRDLADQLRRAANSVVLNLSEGQRSQKGNKHKHYAIAHGSANEVRGALDLAVAWGWIDEARAAFAKLDRLLGLLWGLTHGSARAPDRARSARVVEMQR